ncbi:hypothetical protein [Halopiger thermotolerans]
MARLVREILFGDPFERNLDLLAAAVVFFGTFVAYATELFAVDGGVIVLPTDATAVAIFVAGGIGYRRGSLIGAWVAPFAAYLAFYAEWAILGLSGRSFADKLGFLFDLTRVALVTGAPIVLGTAAYAVGSLFGVGVERLRDPRAES